MAPLRKKEDQQIIEVLRSLHQTPPRDPRAAARGRARFLAEASSMHKTVSPNAFQRLNDWISTKLLRYRKERSPMLGTISSIIIALAVVLGGGGITAFAAQDSLPNEVLYPVKLYLEDARYGLTEDPVTQIELLTKFANNRIDEITGLALRGEAVPKKVVTRFHYNLQTMLQLAAGLDEELATPALQHIRQNLRTQEQLMSQLGQPEELDPALEQLRAMLREQHRLVQEGLDEPGQFQEMYRHGESEPPGSQQENTESKVNQYRDCTEPGECESIGDGEGPGPGMEGGNQEPGGEGPGGGNSGENGNHGEEKPPGSGGSGKDGKSDGNGSGKGN